MKLWEYYRYSLCSIFRTIFPAANNNSVLFILKQKLAGKKVVKGTKDVEIMVPLKYLSNYCRTIEMPLINSKTNLILTWFSNCV